MTGQDGRPWRALRKKMGWTQEEMARKARVSFSTYRRWDRGESEQSAAIEPAWALVCIQAQVPEDWQPAEDEAAPPVTDPTPE